MQHLHRGGGHVCRRDHRHRLVQRLEEARHDTKRASIVDIPGSVLHGPRRAQEGDRHGQRGKGALHHLQLRQQIVFRRLGADGRQGHHPPGLGLLQRRDQRRDVCLRFGIGLRRVEHRRQQHEYRFCSGKSGAQRRRVIPGRERCLMAGISTQLLEGIDVMAAVVDAASFGRAGEALDMSQSGVSRAIARLETRLGIRVFERTTRSVRLTDEGRRFYEQVMPLVGAPAEATGSAAGGAAAVRGRLRVNSAPFFSRLILGPRLGAFLDSHPDLEMDLRSRDDLGDMVADGFDLAIRFGNPRPSSLVARKLFDTRVLTLASPAMSGVMAARPTRTNSRPAITGASCSAIRPPVGHFPGSSTSAAASSRLRRAAP